MHYRRRKPPLSQATIETTLLSIDALAFEHGDRLWDYQFVKQALSHAPSASTAVLYEVVERLAYAGRLRTITDRPTLRQRNTLWETAIPLSLDI